MFNLRKKAEMPSAAEALKGRDFAIPTADKHFVNGAPLKGPYPAGSEMAVFGLGCFWGAERKFWQAPGVIVTAVGYAAGYTPNPTYQEVCSGRTGHNEVVLVVFDPKRIPFEGLLKVFWESHNPTQGMRQGNDVGTQYRSAIFPLGDDQRAEAAAGIARWEAEHPGSTAVTTIEGPAEWYPAEDYHQDYLTLHPSQPYIVYNDLPKIEALKQTLPDLYRADPVLVPTATPRG
jgi:peptide-methionine (S)-S-oxide reductase